MLAQVLDQLNVSTVNLYRGHRRPKIMAYTVLYTSFNRCVCAGMRVCVVRYLLTICVFVQSKTYIWRRIWANGLLLTDDTSHIVDSLTMRIITLLL